jgi:plastocyanin
MRLLSTMTALAAAGVLIAGCGSGSSASGDSSRTGSAASSSGGGNGYGGGAPAKTTATTSGAASGSSAAGALKLSADESNGLAFSTKALAAKAGKVTITMDNPGSDSQPHAIAVEGPGGVKSSGQIAQPGSTSTVSLNIKPGTYTFYCPVPGHRAAGMEGTLTVR